MILARNAPAAVVFRRGPTNQVLLIKWDTARDTFEIGQWFKGRIYERRCDLSPSGRKLIYFAGNQKPPHRTWTAVSTPPFLTALALWPLGSTWGGGGSFEAENRIFLHQGCQSALDDGFALPKSVEVVAQATRPSDPFMRDGWTQVSHDPKQLQYRADYAKQRTVAGRQLELQFHEEAFFEKGLEVLNEFRIMDLSTNRTVSLGLLSWADWDRNDDLLFAREGKLFRAKPNSKGEQAYDLETALQLADFSGLKFENKQAPAEALKW